MTIQGFFESCVFVLAVGTVVGSVGLLYLLASAGWARSPSSLCGEKRYYSATRYLRVA
jgi:hypothetical protein